MPAAAEAGKVRASLLEESPTKAGRNGMPTVKSNRKVREPRPTIRPGSRVRYPELIGLRLKDKVERLKKPKGNGFRRDNYLSEHVYNSFGYYEIGFIDSFLINDIVNIENADEKVIAMFDTVGLFPQGTPFRTNESPKFLSNPLTTVFFDSNEVYLPFSFDQRSEVWEDGYQYMAVPFPSEGYSFPEYSHSFGMEDHVLIWDKPIHPGIYAVCVKVREFRADYLDQYPGDSVLLTTSQRAMIVEIDSSMIVSTMEPASFMLFSVYPNPASETVHIQ